MSDRICADLLGHTDVDMVRDHYTDVDFETLKLAMARLSVEGTSGTRMVADGEKPAASQSSAINPGIESPAPSPARIVAVLPSRPVRRVVRIHLPREASGTLGGHGGRHFGTALDAALSLGGA